MQDAARHLATASDGHLDGRDHQPGLHPGVDGPPTIRFENTSLMAHR
jgi:hypothetical protein